MLSENAIRKLFNHVSIIDRIKLSKGLRRIGKTKDSSTKQTQLASLFELAQSAKSRFEQRWQQRPAINYPQSLPVSQRKDEIIQAIKQNQVVIIAGETGSGKTTQLPKICLEAGRGRFGRIGHTQPRRLAARSVASRIAEEMQSPLGQAVGFKVRFSDQVSDNSFVKLMTDGILLAEIQRDRYLNEYDTLIIDEAHERSLNIDFILGYLKQLLPKRPDLKLIITSATIDVDRFAAHFDNAPTLEVSGRNYPVEVRYNPLINDDSNDRDQIDGIIDAVQELSHEGPGDILIFLSGEREIRDTADALNKQELKHTEIVPLFARLSAAEQNKIFQSHSGRRIVLSTNVAETSLTVPGIRYVIDPGTARLSRYSYRTKVQRLPIEPISQASANQRAGRCGRVAAGICIRLYSEEDFSNRPEFTDPEILRTNLASVILQMLALGLGDIAEFPFVQPPDQRFINDGMRLLEELHAIERVPNRLPKLTDLGRQLSRLPVDPRLARMIIAGHQLDCVYHIIVIVAALSIQDPRERPLDKQQAADEAHKQFADPDSDLISYFNLWQHLQQQQRQLTSNQFRKYCKQHYLNFLRIREWQDIVMQLKLSMHEMKFPVKPTEADYQSIHSAIIAGSLAQLGFKDKEREYLGARNSRFLIFPGSALAKKSPKWVVTSELVETSKLFARGVAKIEPTWVIPFAQHLVTRSYSEAQWDKKSGQVIAYEKQSLYGLVIEPKKRVNFANVDQQQARQVFIQRALIDYEIGANLPFLEANKAVVASIETMEKKQRRRDLLIDEKLISEFYQQHLPQKICSRAALMKWWKNASNDEKSALRFSEDWLLQRDPSQISQDLFPNTWQQGELILPLRYDFEPGSEKDGVTVIIPLGVLNQVSEKGFDWGVPGYRHELVVALIKSLPKRLRRNFVPAPDFATACLDAMQLDDKRLIDAVARQLLRMTGVRIENDDWELTQIPSHLLVRFEVQDNSGKVIATSRQLGHLKEALQGKIKQSLTQVADKGIERQALTEWDFEKLPQSYEKQTGAFRVRAYPALVDRGDQVDIQLFDREEKAANYHHAGQRRLILLSVPSPIKHLQQALPNKAKLGLYFNPFGTVTDLINDCINAACDQLIAEQCPNMRTKQEFEVTRDHVRANLAERVVAIATQVEAILTDAAAVRKKLKGKTSFDLVTSQADIKSHLDSLIYKGFVTEAGESRLGDLLRYINALSVRLEKLVVDSNKDRLAMIEVADIQKAWEQAKNAYSATNIPQELHEVRWMIEELRVSLFAQKIGTAIPISKKRIKNHLQAITQDS